MTHAASDEIIKDDKRIVTDMAFGVSEKLLGIKLATPWQRAVAILIDSILVLMLTDLSGVFWAFFAGIATFHAGKSSTSLRWRRTKKLARFFGAFTVFICTLILLSGQVDWLGDSSSKESDHQQNKSITQNVDSITGVGGIEAIEGEVLETSKVSLQPHVSSLAAIAQVGRFATSVAYLSKLTESPEDCNSDCFDHTARSLVQEMRDVGLDENTMRKILSESIQPVAFPTQDAKAEYIDSLLSISNEPSSVVSREQTAASDLATSNIAARENPTTSSSEKDDKQNIEPTIRIAKDEPDEVNEKSGDKSSESKTYSIVEYIKALIADLGLGFGWAALYFTVFNAWWHGQTPGKRVMGIRVIQLDGTYMNLWDSFGRYGGYGAGFATGLLGFIQVIWDANRQAIQDKISATVVIQGKI